MLVRREPVNPPDGQPIRLRAVLRVPLSVPGLVVAALFWYGSTYPSLLPRSWLSQGVVSALSLCIGYGLGVLGAAIVRGVMTWRGWRGPRSDLRRRTRRVLAVAAGVAGLLALWQWFRWQNAQRDLVDLPHVSVLSVLPMLAVTALVAALLLAIGRVIVFWVRRLDDALCLRAPAWIARLATTVVVVTVAWTLGTDVVVNRFLDWANSSFGALDTDTPPGVHQPKSRYVSGSLWSLAPWATLGYQGRAFAAGSTSQAALRRFVDGGPVEHPVRVYAGLRTANTARERAAIAVRELERTGGFERSVLVVWSATGTGWIDPDAARSLELMWGGDTAIVSTQYSYFPSWISFLVDGEEATAEARALQRAVHRRWSELPVDARPRLIVFGLSLGSYASEQSLAEGSLGSSLANAQQSSDGVLWVGPTNSNPVWRQVQGSRAVASPPWHPVVEHGRVVRYAALPKEPSTADWATPRVLYLAHPSDPVTWFSASAIWSRPPWQEHPIGSDVSPRTRWVPSVTFVQTVADLIAGFSTPPGHGHNYADGYARSWAAVVAPPGWAPADTVRLEAATRRDT